MPIEILMPALSPTMKEGTLVKWCKKEGDKISSGELIAEIETDKATMELEASDDGTLGLILVAEGTQNVQVNEVIAVIFEDDEDGSSYSPRENLEIKNNPSLQSTETTAPPSLTQPHNALSGKERGNPLAFEQRGRQKVSPLARRLAREAGLDVATLQGTGPGGRIIRRDVLRMLDGGVDCSSVSEGALEAFKEVPLSSMRKVIAQRLTESKTTIPHFYVTMEVMMEALLEVRSQLNKKLQETGEKLSINDFFIKACGLALQEVSEANVSWHETFLRSYRDSDIAVAVSIEGGLITPVLKKAQTKTLLEISREMKDLIKRARANKLAPHEYQGGSFTISNMGMYDVTSFSAIINPPHSCILAVGASQEKVGIVDNEIGKVSQATLTLSVDHRAVDGSVAAHLLQVIKKYIESPALLFTL